MNAASSPQPPAHLRIFVVENHGDTLKYLTMYLESFGHSVRSARTMHEALAALPEADCDLFLSDIGLPDGNGWELMERATFSRPVCAVAMSGYGTEADLERSKAAGFHHHLVKPIGGHDLAGILETATRQLAQD
jgi:two-component system CheB/CheR fusion protein